MDKTKYVEEWTAKHLHYPSPDAASLSRRKLPAAPGNSSPDSASEGIAASYDYSKDLLNNTELNNKSNIRPFDRFRNLSMPKRNTTGLEQGYVKNELSMKQNARYKESKRSEVIIQSLIMSSSSSGSGSAPNSARSGSSGYQSRQNVERHKKKANVLNISYQSFQQKQFLSNFSWGRLSGLEEKEGIQTFQFLYKVDYIFSKSNTIKNNCYSQAFRNPKISIFPKTNIPRSPLQASPNSDPITENECTTTDNAASKLIPSR